MLDFLIGFFWGMDEVSEEKRPRKLSTAILTALLLLIVALIIVVKATG
jgi:hypothetical protein